MLALGQLVDGEELEHAILHVTEPVVILVEDSRRVLDVELLLGALAPRQLGDRLEVGADHLRLHRLAAGARQPRPLAGDLLAGLVGKRQFVEPGLEILQRGIATILVAELLLDRAQLLAQVRLALAAAQLVLDLRLDLLLCRHHVELALHVDEDAAQPVIHRERLEHALGIAGGDLEVGRHEIREPAGLGHVVHDLRDRLLGDPTPLRELDGALADLAVESDERRRVRIEGAELGRLGDRGDQVAIDRRHAERDAALRTFEHEAHAPAAALDRAQRGDRADRVQPIGYEVLRVLALGDDEHEVLGIAQRRLDGQEGLGASCRDGQAASREQHTVPHRDDRQGLRHDDRNRHGGAAPQPARNT